MAVVPVIIGFGNSNWNGADNLANVPAADYVRWTGSALPTSYPYTATAPGVRVLTPRLPYVSDIATPQSITGSAANSLTSGSNWPAGVTDRWVYVATNTTGQGQHRRITAGGGTPTVNIAPNWTVNPAANGTGTVLGGSHTVDVGSTTTVINKTAATAAFVAGDVGKWIVMIHGATAAQARKISAVNSATQIVLDYALTGAPAAGDGLCVLSGANAVTGLAQLVADNATLSDLTFFYDNAYPFRTGLDYPNQKSVPETGPLPFKTPALINPIPELTWQLRKSFPEKIHVASVGVTASTMAPLHVGTSLAIATFSWLRDITHLDFHPASPNGLYQALIQTIAALMTKITAEGNEPNVIGIFGVPAENDANSADVAAAFGGNLRTFRDRLRSYIADNGYSKLKPHRIPFLVTNVRTTVFSQGAVVNAAMAELAAQDSRTVVIDTSDITYHADQIHFAATGTIEVAKRMATAWRTIYEADNYASRTIADLPTLATLRAKVRRRHERGTSSNDSTTAQIDEFLNDSLREITNTLGDSAWFLRRAEQATIDSGAFPNTIVLDAHVARLLRVESAACPGYALTWKGINHTSNLRTQITLHESGGSGPYIVHFIQLPPDLVNDTDVAILPGQYVELVVALTCKRLAECVGNSQLATYYGAETSRLWRYVMRDCHRYDRMRQEQMHTANAYDSLRNDSSSNWMWNL